MVEFVIVLICLLINALLSCIEMAFVTVSKPHLKKLANQGDNLAQKAISLKTNPERVLSILQIGITLVGAISAAVGGAGAEEALSPFYQMKFNISEELSESLAIATIVVPLTFLSVIIGELVPKAIALRFPMKVTRLGSPFLIILDKVFSPIVYALELSTKLVMSLFVKNLRAEPMVDAAGGVDIDSLSESNKQYVFNLLSVDKRKIKDIMVPWNEVTKLEKSSHHFRVLDSLREFRYSRVPVLDNEELVGILNYKEFTSDVEITKVNWRELIKPILYVKPDEAILNTLKLMQVKNMHLAVVKQGEAILGIVTMEDIFEEIVGEIYDEEDRSDILLASNSKIRSMSLGKK